MIGLFPTLINVMVEDAPNAGVIFANKRSDCFKAFEFGAVEPKLYNSFEIIMKKGFKAFKAGIK
jgi:hypothetical protein